MAETADATSGITRAELRDALKEQMEALADACATRLSDMRSFADVCRGKPGEAGVAGVDGKAGEAGAVGDTGERGEAGPVGAAGERGEQGLPGDAGKEGAVGKRGEAGPPGDTGPSGPVGSDATIDLRHFRRMTLVAALGPWAAETMRSMKEIETNRVAQANKAEDRDAALDKALTAHSKAIFAAFHRPLSVMCGALARQAHGHMWPSAKGAELKARAEQLAVKHMDGVRQCATGEATFTPNTLVDELVPLVDFIEGLVWSEDA